MTERRAIRKSVRFAVLARDGFRCTYCGAQPPEVVLHLDHVIAIANGGTNDEVNLVTACLPCNLGKGVMVLPDQKAAGTKDSEKRPSPRVEFIWAYGNDRPGKPKPISMARCVESPDWSVPEEERFWRWEEYFRLCRSHQPHYSTHGASTMGFSPYEAAMYAAELVHAPWVDMHRYIEFIDDLILMRAAGHMPAYIAPFVLRALHPETMHARCLNLAPDYEEIGDSLAQQAIAAFRPFIDREHTPWGGRP